MSLKKSTDTVFLQVNFLMYAFAIPECTVNIVNLEYVLDSLKMTQRESKYVGLK